MPEITRITGVPRTSVRDTLVRAGISLRSATKAPSATARSGFSQARWNSPYGFKYERSRLVPHPQEFETLRLILKGTKEGQSFATISVQLNSQKLRPRSASVWTRFTVRQIVKWHEAHPEVIIKGKETILSYLSRELGAKKVAPNFDQRKTKRRKCYGN